MLKGPLQGYQGLRFNLAHQRLRQINGQLKTIEAALAAICAADVALQARFDIFGSIPSIGSATAFAMPIEMPGLSRLEAPQPEGPAGLAPVARYSCSLQCTRSIRGGRRNLRCAIYMPAFVAPAISIPRSRSRRPNPCPATSGRNQLLVIGSVPSIHPAFDLALL
ncbi:transposase [Acidocella sp.]|uniref:transposase n=1 Tax=Acidocella sp. TaxID=50710 RepID=UPI00262F8CD1|nr:transposase [Acidocella sp.]